MKLLKRAPLFPSKSKGQSPEWANLPRRKCDDCGKSYKPKRPLLDGQRGFCCDNHRKSFHKHGGAYHKLKGELDKMVRKEFQDLRAELKLIGKSAAAEAIREYIFQMAEGRIREIVREELSAQRQSKPA